MLIAEVIRPVQRIKPRAVRKQARVDQVVAQKVATAERQPPTMQDVILAQFAYGDLERRTNKAYLKRLERQLASARREIAH